MKAEQFKSFEEAIGFYNEQKAKESKESQR